MNLCSYFYQTQIPRLSLMPPILRGQGSLHEGKCIGITNYLRPWKRGFFNLSNLIQKPFLLIDSKLLSLISVVP